LRQHLFPSARLPKGLSFRLVRLKPVLILVLAALGASPLVGCSRKAEQIVGASRLGRGAQGLGTTVRSVHDADLDTYVDPGGSDSATVLFVGWQDNVEARSFFDVTTWQFPDTLAGFQVISASLLLGHDLSFGSRTPNVSLHETAWTTGAGWPGPPAGTLLGSRIDSLDVAEFSIPLNAGAINLISGWAHSPITGFSLQVTTGLGFAAYRTSTARFQIVYSFLNGTTPDTATAYSAVAQGYFLRSPTTPTAGSGTMVMGGFARSGLALRFPVDSIPAAVSIDEASIVLNLLSDSALPGLADSASYIELRRIVAPWVESVTTKAQLTVQDTLLTSARLRSSYRAGSSTIVIQIPATLLRGWSGNPSTNEGIYVSLRDLVNHDREFQQYRIGSRESAVPPTLHVSFTEVPPGRF